MIKNNPALLLVDVQKAFLEEDYPGLKRNNHNAELICGNILKQWRKLQDLFSKSSHTLKKEKPSLFIKPPFLSIIPTIIAPSSAR